MLRLLRSRMSFRLAVLFLVASLLPVAGGGWLALGLVERSASAAAERRQGLVAELCGAIVAESIEGAEEKLATVGRLLADEVAQFGEYHVGNSSYRAAVDDRLRPLIEPPDPLFLELQYFANGLDMDGEPQFVALAQQHAVAESQLRAPDPEGLNALAITSNLADPTVRDTLERGVRNRGAQTELHEGFRTLRTAEPVNFRERTLGAFVAYVDFGRVRETLRAAAGDEFAVCLTDANGEVLAQAGEIEGEAIGLDRAFGPDGWNVRVDESVERVRGTVDDLRRRASLWIAGAAVFSLLLSLGLSTWITRPVDTLRRAAERMEGGDLEARAGITRPDEIGRLGAAFDRMAAALHQLDEAKSEFVGNVSHELRTPLTSMRLTVANLLDGVVGEVGPRQRESLERVSGDLDRMIDLVNELLELARLEAGVVSPSLEDVDLTRLSEECASAFARAAEAKGITIEVTGDGRARADLGMMQRVLANLVENAVKFSPEGGRVRISVANTEVRVADDGPGVPTDRIFERFRQGTQEGVKNPGVGLGLAIVKKLVGLNGGRVRVENDGGAVFIVELAEADA